MYEEFRLKLNIILLDDFQKELLESSILNLQTDSKLRFNNFAYSLRELSRHFLKSLAPDELINNSVWFKNETKIKNKYSRGERIKYAIQGGLEDRFLEREIMTIQELSSIKKKITDSIEILNKYTHINNNTFNISEQLVKELSNLIMNSFIEFTETITNTRKIIIKSIEDNLSAQIFEKAMCDISEDVDILATHHWMEEVHIDRFHITELNSRVIKIKAEGITEFLLQWGSDGDNRRGDGHQSNIFFPFTAYFTLQLCKNLNNSKPEILDYNIDTSSLYE
ncbi:hypothetical protein HX014_18030 [Myroides marinus]|uniref:pPIWI-associating nuclease domain-containing protein n=1 Tax=Myroides marinus TaxID=703342 RepID=UPI002576F490|nr:hypothetical protein [Myroides marinus]MDM1352460.1 hypothetical protein [Myroides marinus]MDM1359679.1 hypothetical protein [Myroides marinus]